MKERLAQVQETKRALFAKGGSLVMDVVDAALAFGISQQQLAKILEESKHLEITPLRNGSVQVSLVATASEGQRDLWQEMIGSLEKGRSKINGVKQTYKRLALNLQRDSAKMWEGDADLVQLALFALWSQLPLSAQNEMAAYSPDCLRSSLGIIASGE
ncbi:hypothetical protein COT66_01355 [Candidatus Shapirobacteria bacterium CG09_land_8_20_14_0_10_49_15]|uniref:Uncharacterized protein n=2 Tax=Candidatus Shapironibacteriota TaxID=1752721 RepID=A0A2M8L7A1_9BACT|nr:MAG: hypothetical protein COT66_01355 [Candidatus Shapirobacteria bacterium CG09_land_8_20_14_0_10_49_15]PJE70120.1 MAG: hypothetical protein COU97_01470 [Candidatus Shapirobacteria bacterium CG10_big_fil_rev_8_21_14_0_10_48_15]